MIYEIEQYEICITKYRIKASSEAKAIKKLLDGKASAVDNSHEFVEVADDFGLPADEYQELADELRKIDVAVAEVIPSIRSIEEVE